MGDGLCPARFVSAIRTCVIRLKPFHVGSRRQSQNRHGRSGAILPRVQRTPLSTRSCPDARKQRRLLANLQDPLTTAAAGTSPSYVTCSGSALPKRRSGSLLLVAASFSRTGDCTSTSPSRMQKGESLGHGPQVLYRRNRQTYFLDDTRIECPSRNQEKPESIASLLGVAGN